MKYYIGVTLAAACLVAFAFLHAGVFLVGAFALMLMTVGVA